MRGSLWSKWELHIHTPGTKLNDQFLDSEGKSINQSENQLIWKEYCEKLNESGISCFGITDYFSVENFLKLRLNREEWGLNNEIVLFPNIELRVTGLISAKNKKKPHSHVNIHLIFNENIEEIKLKKFLRYLEVSGTNGKSMNFSDDIEFLISNGKIPSLPSIETVKQALIKSLGDRYKDDCIILIPNGSDGISKEEGNGFAQNLNFMKEMVDIIQTINKKDKLFYLNECRSIYDKTYPCISGSDAHSFERFTEYEIEKTTWIKADKTFYGLKSILFEPEERVCIQSNSPDLKLKSKVIDYIKLPQKDFDGQHIYFNSGMNVIVGGRSSGKSLLLSLLAKKVGNVSSLKRNNNLYEQLIQEKLEDTNAFLLDGSATNGDTLIEFFYQDKLQEIASDVNKRNKFIIEIIGEDNQNRQMILDQKIKVLTEINIKMMRERQSNLTLVSAINKFQTEHQIKDNIEEVKSKLKSLYSDNKFQDDDFEKLNQEMQNQISNESRLNQEIKNYESIKQINFYALNSSLPADKRPIINSIHELYKSQLNKLNAEIEGELNRKIDSINVSLEKIKLKISEMKVSEIYRAYGDRIEAKPLIQELEKQEKQLDSLVSLMKEREESNERLNEMIGTIINEINLSDLLTENKILDKLSIKLSVVTSINENILFEIFKSTFKINLNIFKDLACGIFKNLSTWDEEHNKLKSKETLEDLISTLNNILLTNNKEIYKVNNDEYSFISKIAELKYLIRDYKITYKDTDFLKMSEGKKAFVLLLLKLEIGQEDCPLLIDQPEDNLDNRAIVKELVEYLRKQKKKRQVFVVTHNANIVVASDSENIIVANEHDLENPNPNEVKYYYQNGSLENEKIRFEVCEILEGGKPAFKQRENRYNFLLTEET